MQLDEAFGSALIFAPMDLPKVIRKEMPCCFSIPEAATRPCRGLDTCARSRGMRRRCCKSCGKRRRG